MAGPVELIKKGLSEFTDWYARHGFKKLSRLHSDGGTWSGVSVNEASALNHSVVWACRRIISESVAMLPLDMMQKTPRGKFDADQHPMYSGLKNAPNDEMCAMSFREAMTGYSIMNGNAYALIFREAGTERAAELWPIAPQYVTVDREKTGKKRLTYVVKEGNETGKAYTVTRNKAHEILHVPGVSPDGTCGYSVISIASQSIGTAMAAERNVGRFHAAGGRVSYVLERDKPFKSDEQFDQFRADWEKTYAEPHRAPILEPGMKYNQIGLNMADAQMLETRQFTVQEICRWFQVSPHLVADLSHATFSNIENLAQQFVTFTLSGWMKRWEQNLWRCILTPEEKRQGFFFNHNVNALLRGNFQARMSGYATALQNGFFNQNEVRDLEDMNRFEGGDDYHIQLNMQTLPPGTPTTSERAQLAKIGTAAGKERVQ